jgi:hypothetical protein
VPHPVNGVTQSESDFSALQGAKSAELQRNFSDEGRSGGEKAPSDRHAICGMGH